MVTPQPHHRRVWLPATTRLHARESLLQLLLHRSDYPSLHSSNITPLLSCRLLLALLLLFRLQSRLARRLLLTLLLLLLSSLPLFFLLLPAFLFLLTTTLRLLALAFLLLLTELLCSRREQRFDPLQLLLTLQILVKLRPVAVDQLALSLCTRVTFTTGVLSSAVWTDSTFSACKLASSTILLSASASAF